MKRVFLLFALAFANMANAGPQLNVGTMYDYLDGDKSTFLKRIYNGGDSTAFVKVSILEIIYGDTGAPEEVPVENQANLLARDGLMASPARLIVPANGMQGARLLFMGNREQERYFRVRFVPVVPEQEDEFAVSAQEREAYRETLTAGVSVLAGYGTIFFVRPVNTRFDTELKRDGDQYVIRNKGNSVVIVDEFRDCAVANESDCDPVTKHHVLPGKVYQFKQERGREYRFNLIEGEQKRQVEVKA